VGEGRNFRLWMFVILPLFIAFILTVMNHRSPVQSSETPPLALRQADSVLFEEIPSVKGEEIFGGDEFNVITDEEKREARKYPPVKFQEYKVKNGDNIWKIAKRFGLDFYTILSVNRLRDANYLKPGQRIRIPNQRGVLHKVKPGETLEDISLMYDVSIARIVGANGITDPNQIHAGAELFIPGANLTYSKQREIAASSNILPTFIKPAYGRISSGFGYRIHPVYRRRMFHAGIDIAARYGSTVYAARSGRVKYAGWLGGYGKVVVIDHRDGYETRYAHCSSILVRKGQWVRQGQPIARVGRSGVTTGTHLHFEIRRNGKPVNPMKFLSRHR